ncbi:MAG: hypothetical protein HY687_06575 [Chloroflexi bacterium]|nr:hypothetical protein [Chloroflexota bacterium]
MLLNEYEYLGSTNPFHVDNERKAVSYLTRVDPFSGATAKISEERARRNLGINTQLNITPIAHCDFCDYQTRTPLERLDHGCGAISVPNKFPWEKYDWITIYPPFGDHKLLLSDLHFDDLDRLIESSSDLAQICAQDQEVIAFMDFTNWGAFAGASQQHPHSQRKSITGAPDPRQATELARCRALWERHGRNPFDLLADEERGDGRRVVYDNHVYIGAAFAPSCPNEVILFPRSPVSHVLQMSPPERREIIRPALGLFPALFFYRGVTDLNIAIHQAPFRLMEEARSYYRWHMHIYPRRSRLPADRAGAELGFETGVIDVLPEVTAHCLRLWYQQGPKEEHVGKYDSGTANHTLVEAFRGFLQGNNHHRSRSLAGAAPEGARA